MGRCVCWASVMIGIIVGIIVGILVNLEIISGIVEVASLTLFIAFFALMWLIFAALFSDRDSKKCTCMHGLCLLAGTIGTIITGIVLFAIINFASLGLVAVIFGIGGLFFTITIASLIKWIACLILSACRCRE